LLRKKVEPGVERWIEEHTTQTTNHEPGSRDLENAELRKLWAGAAPMSQGIVGPMLEEDGAFGDDFTIAEREGGVENVVTGLKRKLDGGDSESDDDDYDFDDEGDEKMKDEDSKSKIAGDVEGKEEGIDTDLPPIPLESLLRFMTTGAVPVEVNYRPG
jgi:mediator of RNA polymerase II transcription subunit 8, fungi type